jgi:hypothetical protein
MQKPPEHVPLQHSPWLAHILPTGVQMSVELQVSDTAYRLEITPAGDRRYLTEFIGRNGRVLARSTTLRPSYRFTGGEGYVRARISDSSGRMAWTQPRVLR